MKGVLFALSILMLSVATQGQVLIDDTATPNNQPHPSAVLELRSDDKGLLIPRISSAPSNPEEGLIYYDQIQKCFKGFNGTTWAIIGADCLVDAPTVYTISIADAPNADEGDGFQEFTVTISPAVKPGETVLVIYETQEQDPVSADSDVDYYSDNDFVEFVSGTTSTTIEVLIEDDTITENDETYNVVISSPDVSPAGTTSTATISNATAAGTITDNDTEAPSNSFTENFNDQTFNSSNSTSYVTIDTFYGADNTTWNCVARTSLQSYEIDGNGLMFSNVNSNYCDVTFPNGISTISFDYRAGFTTSGDREIEILKNGDLIGTTGTFSVSTGTTTLSPAINVNETGTVTLRINQAASKQTVIDNVTWTR